MVLYFYPKYFCFGNFSTAIYSFLLAKLKKKRKKEKERGYNDNTSFDIPTTPNKLHQSEIATSPNSHSEPFRFLEQVDVHKLRHAPEFPKMPSILSQNSKHRPKLLIITKHIKILTFLFSLSSSSFREKERERERESVCVCWFFRERN